MEDSTELRDRVNKVECTVQDLSNRVSVQEVKIDRVQKDSERLVDIFDLLSSAIQKLEITLVSMSGKIDKSEDQMKTVVDKIGKIEKKIEDSDEKSKIDFRTIVKGSIEKILMILIGGGLTFILLSIDKLKGLF